MIDFLTAFFSDFQLGVIGFFVLLGFVALRVPLALCLFMVGLGGLWVVEGQPNGAQSRLADEIFGTFTAYSFTIIPLFLLMGEFALRGGLGRSLFDAASAWLGHRKGGVAMAAVGASAGFGAVCGSSLATASTMGKVALPELRRLGYSGAFSTGTLAAGGTLGILIPPSLLLVIYSILAEQNIEKLFTAAYIPGILAALGYGLAIFLTARFGQGGGNTRARVAYRDRLRALVPVWPVIIIFVFILVGITRGWFSPTTAASIGASGTGLIVWLQGNLGWQGLKDSLLGTAKTSVMIMFIVVGANVFNSFLSSAGLPQVFADFFLGSGYSPWLIIIGMLLLYLVLGMVMDSLAMIFLTVPIFLPIVSGLDFGFSSNEETLIWFGILVLMSAEVGLITPPVGMNLFVINSLAKDVPIGQTYRGVLPFIVTDIIRIGILVAFPFLSLWLVRQFFTFLN